MREIQDVVGKILGSFSDDLDISDHSIARAPVGDERFKGHPRDELPNPAAGLDEVVGMVAWRGFARPNNRR